jgi:hypothetical protein
LLHILENIRTNIRTNIRANNESSRLSIRVFDISTIQALLHDEELLQRTVELLKGAVIAMDGIGGAVQTLLGHDESLEGAVGTLGGIGGARHVLIANDCGVGGTHFA